MTAFRSQMARALELARLAEERGEVPVGAVIADARGEVIAVAGNETRARKDPTAHAEILAIRDACIRTGSERLTGCSLWVTLEPCPMCASAIGIARLDRLYFGASDPKSGGVEHGPRVFDNGSLHHAPEIYGGLAEAECAALLKSFFSRRR